MSFQTERGRPQHQRQKQIFDEEYERYREYRLENWRLSYLKRIFRGLELNNNDTLLDIGVGGSGYTVIEAAREGIKAVGVDLSSEGVKKAVELAKQTQNSPLYRLCKFAVCSAEALPFPDSTFTKVCSIAVMEHVPDDAKAFDEIARTTAVGGKIFICVPNTYETMPFIYLIINKINDKRVGHLRHYDADNMIKEFEKRGFELEDLTYHAHNIKLLSFCLEFIIPTLKKSDSKLWWYLDRLDTKQKDNPRSMNFSIRMTKNKGFYHCLS